MKSNGQNSQSRRAKPFGTNGSDLPYDPVEVACV
jgi:hypothetical protein